ncbi:hypothetical protein EKO04_011452 [Ascochyta lentis]|uniref:Auxiliary Activity family 9 catalytic domain-containing protein n=1 Tax=Ascochyta lentis TaxID=205686 RepID=A0A8H7IU08_9PLEO|nr:hypothetical protein EKO04_011452 [Ascochyta lentis]
MLSKIATVAAFAAGALAHGTVNGVTIDGKFEQGFSLDYYYAKQNGQTPPEHIGWYAENLDNGFVEPNSFSKPDIICHKAASPEGSSDTMAKVAAGGTVEFHWTTWPASHMGPVITYVAPYTGDVASVDKATLKWTKIDAHGYEGGEWAAVKMIGQNNTWPVTVPESLAAGKYVFRHEIIALHGAASANGAQNYPQCLNIEVTGSGTETPEGVVGTSLYTVDDVIFNPYAATIDYKIPGPALWPAGSGSSSPSPSTPSNGTASATPSAAVSSAAAASSVAVEATPVATPSASSAPAASSPADSGSELPETFTLDTFIAWLEKAAGSSA